MELKVKLENGMFDVYGSRSEIIGKIKIDPKANFNESQIIIGNKNYHLKRNKWVTSVSYNKNEICKLQTSSFSGNTEIKELNRKIIGVWGAKWGTQLTDENGKTLTKIRNESKLTNDGNYIIQLNEKDISQFEILITLYAHLYSSSLIEKGVLIELLSS